MNDATPTPPEGENPANRDPRDQDSDMGEQKPTVMRLDDFLKRCGLAGTGGQAKFWIQNGDVKLNGEIETRRRKQLALGDVIEVLGHTFTLSQEHYY